MRERARARTVCVNLSVRCVCVAYTAAQAVFAEDQTVFPPVFGVLWQVCQVQAVGFEPATAMQVKQVVHYEMYIRYDCACHIHIAQLKIDFSCDSG